MSYNIGYVYMWRQIQDCSFYRNPICCHLAIHLLIRANWVKNIFTFNQEKIEIDRGQLLTGRKKLAEETGLSQQQVRTSLKILKKTDFITMKATNKFTVITICKYNDYQNQDMYINQDINQQVNQQITNKEPTNNQQITTNNNNNNNNNINKENKKNSLSAKNQQTAHAERKPLSVETPLTAETQQTVKDPLPAKKKQTVPEVKLFIDAWFTAYLNKFREKYNVSGGKEGTIVKTLISKYGYDKLKKLAWAFWTSTDSFIINSDYTIGVFYSQINKLNANKNNPAQRYTKAQLRNIQNMKEWENEQANI